MAAIRDPNVSDWWWENFPYTYVKHRAGAEIWELTIYLKNFGGQRFRFDVEVKSINGLPDLDEAVRILLTDIISFANLEDSNSYIVGYGNLVWNRNWQKQVDTA